MTAIARAALLLAALACWRGGSLRASIALLVTSVASACSTLPLPARVVYAIYLVAPAASVWFALRVAVGRGWPAVLAWVLLAAWTWLAPRGSPWAAVALAAAWSSVIVQLGAVALIGRPRTAEQRTVLILAAGDVAALLMPRGAPWWLIQGQAIIVSAVVIWTHREKLA